MSSSDDSSDYNDSDDNNDVSDDEEESKTGEEVEDEVQSDEPDEFKQELSNVPFEELLEMKKKLSQKMFNESIIGKMRPDRSQDKSQKEVQSKTFKRLNKNRPREMSAKRPVNRPMEVFAVKKKKELVDPRFEEKCGRFNERVFKQTYGFVDQLRDKEVDQLKKELKKTKNEERKKEISYLLQRMKNQNLAKQEKQNKVELVEKLRKQDEGSTKRFVNKSTLKKVQLVEKFKNLKKTGKLNKYLEKKRKRNATRERKRINL